MNARIAKRKILNTPIVFEDEWQNEFLYFLSENISASGVLINTTLLLKAGTKVFLKFFLPNKAEPIRTSALVMRQQSQKRGPGRRKPVQKGIGLKFSGLSAKDFVALRDFTESNTL